MFVRIKRQNWRVETELDENNKVPEKEKTQQTSSVSRRGISMDPDIITPL